MLAPVWILLMTVGGVSLAILFPLLRLYRRTGVFGIVGNRAADPAQGVVGATFGMAIGVLVAYAAAWSLLGREAVAGWAPPAALELVGVVSLCVGLVVVILAQAQMGDSWRIGVDDRPTALVTRGLYTIVRNPIYMGLFLLLGGLCCVAPSPWSLMGTLWMVSVTAIQVRLEEAHMLRLHGDEFRAYAARVGRFFPGIGRL